MSSVCLCVFVSVCSGYSDRQFLRALSQTQHPLPLQASMACGTIDGYICCGERGCVMTAKKPVKVLAVNSETSLVPVARLFGSSVPHCFCSCTLSVHEQDVVL